MRLVIRRQLVNVTDELPSALHPMLLSLGDCVHDAPPGPSEELLPDIGEPAILCEFCSGVRRGQRRGCRSTEQPRDSDLEPTKSPIGIADVQRCEGSYVEATPALVACCRIRSRSSVAVSPSGKQWFYSQAQRNLPEHIVNRRAPIPAPHEQVRRTAAAPSAAVDPAHRPAAPTIRS